MSAEKLLKEPYGSEKDLEGSGANLHFDIPPLGTSEDPSHLRTNQKISPSRKLQLIFFALLCCCLPFLWLLRPCSPEDVTDSYPDYHLVKHSAPVPAATPSSAVLEVFQVYQPVLTPKGVTDETAIDNGVEETTTIASTSEATSCKVLLMDHSFGYSYGMPFIGNYTPPSCKFNRVTMNFTVTSRGRQFDRLALMYFGDSEVWRTSTAEPTTNGIRWEYIKDMTEYLYFWNSPQTLIFDLGNLIDDTYTGFFNTTLTATFFTSQETVSPADLIIPISARHGSEDAVSVFTVPGDNATNTISFPQNANRAVFTVSACGQSAEEFWWGNVLSSDVSTFEPYDGTLYGYSPFREVQVLIDGTLAGVQWPFPVIFTGGVVPGLWRPIVGLDAFDLREHEIDITPWLPILCDGSEHTFEIRVAGISDDGNGSGILTETVGSYWLVTGKIFVWLDPDTSVTTGSTPTILLPAPVISTSSVLTQNATGANETLTYTTNVQRTLSISSTVKTANGSSLSTWTQSLSVTNWGQYTEFGAIQINQHKTHGLDQSTGATYYKTDYTYPVWVNTTYIVLPGGNFTLDAAITRGMDLTVSGNSVFPSGLQPFAYLPAAAPLVSGFSGSTLSTTQNGTAHYFGSPSAGTSSGYGSTGQVFTFGGADANSDAVDTELYYRDVQSVNSRIVRDVERLVGVELGSYSFPVEAVGSGVKSMGVVSAKAAIGRGKGSPKQSLVGGA
ncbi:Peptide-N4-(N-acetyl-beta-glucosaminyl)asparagine amidase A protein [Rutstroemia sp. NJR-2017a WRK4]|nr:Peptide-N4-(N-acetyl-beta-glucosaminyl)asparagine amidase A protein [Rutstroemia sp. NJR-2017a WRK4]